MHNINKRNFIKSVVSLVFFTTIFKSFFYKNHKTKKNNKIVKQFSKIWFIKNNDS